MTWRLIFSNSARRNLRKLPLNDRRRLDRAMDELALDPAQGDVLPMRNHPTEFRKRVGDYRIFFGCRARPTAHLGPRYRPAHVDYLPKAAVTDGELPDKIAAPDAPGRELLLPATQRMHLTARGYHRVLRVARTIAHLDGTPQIRRAHIAEALSFRRVAPERR